MISLLKFMKPNFYKIISHSVNEGVKTGWDYAHEYSERPSEENIKCAIVDHVIQELYSWFLNETEVT